MDPEQNAQWIDPHALTLEDFRDMGAHVVAYVRPVAMRGKTLYAVHAADGTPLSLVDSEDKALDTIEHHDMEPVRVH